MAALQGQRGSLSPVRSNISLDFFQNLQGDRKVTVKSSYYTTCLKFKVTPTLFMTKLNSDSTEIEEKLIIAYLKHCNEATKPFRIVGLNLEFCPLSTTPSTSTNTYRVKPKVLRSKLNVTTGIIPIVAFLQPVKYAFFYSSKQLAFKCDYKGWNS